METLNFYFDIERDGYLLPNGLRFWQLENFDEQRKETGCSWEEFFRQMWHEHHHVMDRSGKNPDKTYQIFYTRTLDESMMDYLEKKQNRKYYFNVDDFELEVNYKHLNEYTYDSVNNFYVINLFGSEQFLFSQIGPEVTNLKERHDSLGLLNLNPEVYDKLRSTDLKLLIITFHEGGVTFDEFYQKLYTTIKVSQLQPNRIYYINANASAKEQHEIWCDKNNIPINDRIKVYFTDWLFSLATSNYGGQQLSREVRNFSRKREYNYLLFNRSVFKEHRMWILGELEKRNILKNTLYSIVFPYENEFEYRRGSFTGFDTFAELEQYNDTLPYMEIIKQKGEVRLDDFPTTKRCNYDDIDPFTATFEPYFADSYLSIVTESTFNVTQISEKIAKPLRYMHPFIVVSGPKYLQALRNMGFRTFSKYFDESYDDEFDDKKRMEKIIKLIEELNNNDKLEKIYSDCREDLLHNSMLCEKMNVRKSLKNIFKTLIFADKIL